MKVQIIIPTLITVFGFTGSVTACSDSNQVLAAIDNYVNDVKEVNDAFDNQPASIGTTDSLFFETDEVTQLDLIADMCNFPSDPHFAADLMTVRVATQQVLGVLADLQQGVSDVTTSRDDITQVRCCTILPGLDQIFAIAALQLAIEGDVLSLTAPRPRACIEDQLEIC